MIHYMRGPRHMRQRIYIYYILSCAYMSRIPHWVPGDALVKNEDIIIREPTHEDQKHQTTDLIIDEAESVALLGDRMEDEVDANILNEIADALNQEYPTF